MATGNPRNKVALKPGFSLIGWIRLTNSGQDLAGKRGSVTAEELRKHNKPDDCWMCIRGKVYNVTRYLDFHPGGAEQLMRGAGKDATSLFDEYHAWVNYEQLLAKCLIGPLKNVVTLDLSDICETTSKKSPTSLSPPTTAMSSLLPPVKEVDRSAIKSTPRFDWIQKKNDLTVYFYCKSFSNPGLIIERICDKECKVTIFVSSELFTFKFSFYKDLKWPPMLKVNQETGKVEITFEKIEAELWSSYGLHEGISADQNHIFREFSIFKKEFINHDSFEFILRPKSDKFIHFTSLGHHVDLKLQINEKEIIRSYTPIPIKYVSEGSCMNFLIKNYQNGTMSKSLCDSHVGDSIFVSQQSGSFELSKLNSHINVAFLAAGSGITPFCGLLEHLLKRNTSKIKQLLLYDYNKTEADIWFREMFNEIAKADKRFEIRYILSEADELWTGERGKISEKILDELTKLDVTIALICGPVAFNTEAQRILGSSPKIEAICFQG